MFAPRLVEEAPCLSTNIYAASSFSRRRVLLPGTPNRIWAQIVTWWKRPVMSGGTWPFCAGLAIHSRCLPSFEMDSSNESERVACGGFPCENEIHLPVCWCLWCAYFLLFPQVRHVDSWLADKNADLTCIRLLIIMEGALTPRESLYVCNM